MRRTGRTARPEPVPERIVPPVASGPAPAGTASTCGPASGRWPPRRSFLIPRVFRIVLHLRVLGALKLLNQSGLRRLLWRPIWWVNVEQRFEKRVPGAELRELS